VSIRLMTAVWSTDMPSAGRKLVALALADIADDEGRCWPSVRHIARKCSMDERSVQRHLRDLEREGLIERQDRPGRSRIYWLRGDILSPPSKCHPVKNDRAGRQNVTPPPPNLTPIPTNTLNYLPPTPKIEAQEVEEYIQAALRFDCRDKEKSLNFCSAVRKAIALEGGQLLPERRAQLLRWRQQLNGQSAPVVTVEARFAAFESAADTEEYWARFSGQK